MYTDSDVAELYNLLNPWGESDAWYLTMAMHAASVLDVGCGTGTLLHRARESGHQGRLAGVDPDAAALVIARRRSDIAWVEATAAAMPWTAEFDLAIMMNHAFQSLISDTDIQASLAVIRRALTPGGRFAFETRNPRVREWEAWRSVDRDHPIEVIDHRGQPVRVSYQILAVEDDVVTLTETTADANDEILRADEGKLRFLDRDRLSGWLTGAGFTIEDQFGDWQQGPLTVDSAEIVTIARG